MPHEFLSPMEDIIEDARNGRMCILVDDESRENEGDLIIPAQMATPDAVNFMATFGRGLICLALPRARVDALRLPMMNDTGGDHFGTAFTVSIEAREGVTTGISAADRARTIAVATDPARGANDIVTPGHVFPLVAKDGGVLVRAGHTEASVDMARLAGLIPGGVICEIMNDDGTMARMPDLVVFARRHGLKIGTIADLIAYRRRTEKLVRRELEAPFSSIHGGQWKMVVYVNTLNYAEHVVLVKGHVADGDPVLVRIHPLSVLDDVLGESGGGKALVLQSAMRAIAREGRGVVLLIREPVPTALSDRARAMMGRTQDPRELRDYGIGAQILMDMGVSRIIQLSNSHTHVIGLDGHGLAIVERRRIEV